MNDERKELWMWRFFAISLLVLILMTTMIQWLVTRSDRGVDNAARAQAWQAILDANRNTENIVQRNGVQIDNLREQLHRCASCHTHPEGMTTAFPVITKK